MAPKLTIIDIARLSGVSKSTVSRVLTNNPNVDSETATRVRRVIEEHGYVPNPHASAIKGKSALIGIVVPKLNWNLMPEVFLGLASVLDGSPYEIVVLTSDPAKGYQDVMDRLLTNGLVAGLLVVPYAPLPDYLVRLPEKGIPVALINIVSWQTNLPSIGADNTGGAYSVVRHLIDQGHKRIAYIQGPPSFPCSHERYQGYCMALREAGMKPDPQHFFPGDFHWEGGIQAIEQISQMAPGKWPTAIFAANDVMAYGVLQEAEKRNIRIPEDIALVGFDDIQPSAFTRPGLTTVQQPFRAMGECASELLLSHLDAKRSFLDRWSAQPGEHIDIRLPCPLIIRASSDRKMS